MSITLGVRACPVCGASDVRSDAVEHGGSLRAASGTRAGTRWLLLAECSRCDHRWTQPLREEPGLARVPVRAVQPPEVASAA